MVNKTKNLTCGQNAFGEFAYAHCEIAEGRHTPAGKEEEQEQQHQDFPLPAAGHAWGNARAAAAEAQKPKGNCTPGHNYAQARDSEKGRAQE